MKTRLVLLALMAMLLASCDRVSREDQCAEMIRREQRRLPRNVANGLVLDSMRYSRASLTITYYHTMCDTLYTPDIVQKARGDLYQQLQQEIINSVSLKRLKDEGISFRYVYLAQSDGSTMLEMTFENKLLK